jgi:hypothetical protein
MEDFIIDWIIGFVGFGIAYWMGWNAHKVQLAKRMAEDPESMIKVLKMVAELNKHIPDDAEIEGAPVLVRTELVNGVVYAYAKDTNQFLGQGATAEEVLEAAKKRFPGKSFWLIKNEQSNRSA